MSENIFGPGLQGEMAGYLREIPVDDGTTDIGRPSKRYRTAYVEQINGSPVGDFVAGPASSVTGHLPSFNGTTGKLIADSGVAANSVVVGPASVVAGHLSSYNGTTGKLVADSGIAADSVVTGPIAPSVAGSLAFFADTSARVLDVANGIIAPLVLQDAGPGGTTGNVPSYTAGRILGDSGVPAVDIMLTPMANSTFMPFSGGTFTGDVNHGTHNVSGIGALAATSTNAGALTASSATLTGDISMAGHDITSVRGVTATGLVNAARVLAASSSFFSGYTSGGFLVSYTANTPKLVGTTTLTELFDPIAEFTPTVGTGRVEYTGVTTRYWNVRILFNILPPAATAQTFTAWISKNGSTTQVAPRAMNITTATPLGYLPYEVQNVYQLAQNDNVQLAAQYTATANVNVFDIQVIILPVT